MDISKLPNSCDGTSLRTVGLLALFRWRAWSVMPPGPSLAMDTVYCLLLAYPLIIG